MQPTFRPLCSNQAATGMVRPSENGATTVSGVQVNDVHSRLNATCVTAVESPRSLEEVCAFVRREMPVSISGGCHAMGRPRTRL